MRFARLVVESFQAIERAELEFGAGLNVLYGPNDLGKSTVATAIRAALLVPPNSSEADAYTSWYADAAPRVSLTLVDDEGRYWKIIKAFGSAANNAAELQHSKDGRTFALDCKARQVEEKIRNLLGWGIRPPGGKGGPKGLPTSFLANVLLAAQTDVDTILGESLADDLDGSGKLRLTKALATLAQDPVFKKILDAAQKEYDLCFTATGRRKRGQGSKFLDAGNAVKNLQAALEDLRTRLQESCGIEEKVNELRERRDQAAIQVAEAGDSLAEARRRFENTQTRRQAQGRVEEALRALAEIDAHAQRTGKLASEVETLAGRVKTLESGVGEAAAKIEMAEGELRTAEEAHRLVTSEDGARQREVRRAQLEAAGAGLALRRQEAQNRKAAAEAAVKVLTDAENARLAVKHAAAEREKVQGELARSRRRFEEAETELEVARATLAYGRWKSAAQAAEEAARGKKTAEEQRGCATQKEAEAASLESRARAIDERLAGRQEMLPSDEEAKVLERLERDLQIAEAALGGGLSVAVRPRTGVAIRAEVDQQVVLDEQSLTVERVLEAERRVHLTVGEDLEIEIAAGAAEKRRRVTELRARWQTEVVPVLERAGASTLADLTNAIAADRKDRSDARDLRAGADRLREEAARLRETAAVHETQAEKHAAGNGDLEARRTAIGAADLRVLEARFLKLGKGWESKGEALHRSQSEGLKTLQAQVSANAQAAALAEQSVTEAGKRAEELGSTSDRALASLGSADPGALLAALGEEIKSVSRSEAENAARLKALAEEGSSEVARAAAKVAAAGEGVRSAKEAHRAAVSALDAARAELNAGQGRLAELKSQLARMDLRGAEDLVKKRQRELSALPDEPAVSESEVAMAERRFDAANQALERAKEDLHKQEGALSTVGGAALREEVERAKEALQAAQSRERELEVDADAWKLLLDTLRAVENEEGAHLGRALAGPVTERFIELTGGRYDGLRLDPLLKTEGLEVPAAPNSPDVLGALSAGTRDQLATLIRLTIAEQLQSAIVLDDHLVHTDPARLAWFREVLRKTSLNAQVIVLTCRPEDYLAKEDLPPAGTPSHDLAGGAVRAIDVAQVVKRTGP